MDNNQQSFYQFRRLIIEFYQDMSNKVFMIAALEVHFVKRGVGRGVLGVDKLFAKMGQMRGERGGEKPSAVSLGFFGKLVHIVEHGLNTAISEEGLMFEDRP